MASGPTTTDVQGRRAPRTPAARPGFLLRTDLGPVRKRRPFFVVGDRGGPKRSERLPLGGGAKDRRALRPSRVSCERPTVLASSGVETHRPRRVAFVTGSGVTGAVVESVPRRRPGSGPAPVVPDPGLSGGTLFDFALSAPRELENLWRSVSTRNERNGQLDRPATRMFVALRPLKPASASAHKARPTCRSRGSASAPPRRRGGARRCRRPPAPICP